MHKRHLLSGSISHGIYEISDKENVRIEDFAEAMTRLADEYLRGAVELSVSGKSDGYTKISISATSELIKRTIAGIVPDDILRISIELSGDMRIMLSAKELPSYGELAYIISLAKSAGYTVTRDERSITLEAKAEFSHSFSIYAMSSDDLYRDLEYSFVFKN